MIKKADGYDLQLGGFLVVRCMVDFAFTIELANASDHALIRIEAPFTYATGSTVHALDPGGAPEGLGVVLGLGRDTSIVSVYAARTGSLEVRFDSGAVLTVVSRYDLEAWTLNAPDGILLIGGPGEVLTVFRP